MDYIIIGSGSSAVKFSPGGQTAYALLNLENGLTVSKPTDTYLAQLFNVKDIAEVDEWLNLEHREFINKCIKQFRLYDAYGTTARELFFKIVRYLEDLVTDLHKMAFDCTAPESIDPNTSSPILAAFGKDPKINALATVHYDIRIGNIFAKAKEWKYGGFCPHVVRARFDILCDFPFDEIIEILGRAYPILYKKEKIQPPMLDDVKIAIEYINTNMLEACTLLYKRISEQRKQLQIVEDYFVKCAKQAIEMANEFDELVNK